MADVERLIEMLQKLTDAGNSVLVIEHNLDVIKTADHIIDLGPEGGDGGGTIVAQGTPEEVARVPESYTGQWLQKSCRKAKAPNRKNARFGAFLWNLPRAQTSVIFSAGLKWPRGWPQTGQNSGGSVPSCTRPQTVQIQRMGCALR